MHVENSGSENSIRMECCSQATFRVLSIYPLSLYVYFLMARPNYTYQDFRPVPPIGAGLLSLKYTRRFIGGVTHTTTERASSLACLDQIPWNECSNNGVD